MTRLPKNPVLPVWRSARVPVWTHAVLSPLLVWDVTDGVVDGALDALREGRGAASGLPAPSADELADRVADELAISLAAVRSCTQAYGDSQWGHTKLGPRADALWLACDGYIDLLDAQAAGGRTAQPFSSSL